MDISPQERSKYAEIFQANGPVNGFLSGAQARTIFLNSGLHVAKLERIWGLADIDRDGQLDFDEFTVAMRLTYSVLNGEVSDPPSSLPPSWIPPSKMHYLGYGSAARQIPMATGYQAVQPQPTGFVQPQPTGYPGQAYQPPPEFDWNISPQDSNTYEGILAKYANTAENGKLRFQQMEDFYSTLPISKEEISQAWSLVDVNHTGFLTHAQLIVFLHILSNRSGRGVKIPSSLPSSLKTTFAGHYAADLDDRPGSGTGQRKGTNTPMSASASLAESYANRMGVATSSLSSRGSAFGNSGNYGRYDEEEFLKRELDGLKEQVRTAEAKSFSQSSSSTSYKGVTQGTVKSQLQALYDYKLKQLTESEDIEGRVIRQEKAIIREKRALKDLEDRAAEVRSERRRLESVLEERKKELERARWEVQSAR